MSWAPERSHVHEFMSAEETVLEIKVTDFRDQYLQDIFCPKPKTDTLFMRGGGGGGGGGRNVA